jgi:hypothetical protein
VEDDGEYPALMPRSIHRDFSIDAVDAASERPRDRRIAIDFPFNPLVVRFDAPIGKDEEHLTTLAKKPLEICAQALDGWKLHSPLN